MKVRLDAAGKIEGVRKIAVLRCTGLADFLLAMPALTALRQSYPEAEIVLLGKDRDREFLSGRPGPVDRVIAVPVTQREANGQNGLAELEGDCLAELEGFFATLAGEGFDLALQMQDDGRLSNHLIGRIGARVTAGFRGAEAVSLDFTVPYLEDQHEVLRCLELAAAVGAADSELEPRLQVTAEDEEALLAAEPGLFDANDLGGDSGLLEASPAQPLVVLHPGAADGLFRWPPERFGELAIELCERGCRTVIAGTAEEHRLVDAVLRRAAHYRQMRRRSRACARGRISVPVLMPRDVSGRLSLRALAALMARAHLVVASDSAPLRLAQAVGTKTVGVFWCRSAFAAAPLTRSRHRLAVSWRLSCPVCGKDLSQDDCEHHVSLVADIGLDDVLVHALDLLEL